ncbi:Gti1/Pac2 family-domain-containing protein [Roridomyces roridus]|uniref:Gti1/Pac2 family-domain-containing protein n=1 Tax=Roridomyces roridus TaxID=1738132 RepID=A0AAD7AXC0_9AGAR|nr:Gti1/Pac2 family-domain-containing protein [Roridomyces roridus]
MSAPPHVPVEPPWSGWIATTGDALLILEAARRGLIPRVTRRLAEVERKSLIASGAVFVFDEEESGIKRWTDGCFWSPSRILGNFLLYRETEKKGEGHGRRKRKRGQEDDDDDEDEEAEEDAEADDDEEYKGRTRSGASLQPLYTSSKALSRPRSSAVSTGERTLLGSLTNNYKFKANGLMKKTFSVTLPAGSSAGVGGGGGTQHLVSYYSPADVTAGRLRAPSSLPELATLEIAEGLLDRDNFRCPPKTEIGADGRRRYRGEADEVIAAGGAATGDLNLHLGSSALGVVRGKGAGGGKAGNGKGRGRGRGRAGVGVVEVEAKVEADADDDLGLEVGGDTSIARPKSVHRDSGSSTSTGATPKPTQMGSSRGSGTPTPAPATPANHGGTPSPYLPPPPPPPPSLPPRTPTPSISPTSAFTGSSASTSMSPPQDMAVSSKRPYPDIIAPPSPPKRARASTSSGYSALSVLSAAAEFIAPEPASLGGGGMSIARPSTAQYVHGPRPGSAASSSSLAAAADAYKNTYTQGGPGLRPASVMQLHPRTPPSLPSVPFAAVEDERQPRRATMQMENPRMMVTAQAQRRGGSGVGLGAGVGVGVGLTGMPSAMGRRTAQTFGQPGPEQGHYPYPHSYPSPSPQHWFSTGGTWGGQYSGPSSSRDQQSSSSSSHPPPVYPSYATGASYGAYDGDDVNL